MSNKEQIIGKLTKQAVGGQTVLLKFFQKVLEEEPENIRHIELTYFALSVTTVFYLQYGGHGRKQEIMHKVNRMVLMQTISSNGHTQDVEQAQKEYQERLAEYSKLITNLLKENNYESPLVTLMVRFYEHATRQPAADKAFDTRKAGKILSKYIIDNVKYIQEELGD